MKSKHRLLGIIIICCISIAQKTNAQDTWSSWNHTISAKGYEGRSFRLQAQVKAAVEDDSASARLWARVDKINGNGFFENMWLRPIRNTDWKTYTIEGKIDSGATQLIIGALCELNGKFYYDNFKVEIQRGKNKWETIYTADFEKGMEEWQSGIGKGESGINNRHRRQPCYPDFKR